VAGGWQAGGGGAGEPPGAVPQLVCACGSRRYRTAIRPSARGGSGPSFWARSEGPGPPMFWSAVVCPDSGQPAGVRFRRQPLLLLLLLLRRRRHHRRRQCAAEPPQRILRRSVDSQAGPS